VRLLPTLSTYRPSCGRRLLQSHVKEVKVEPLVMVAMLPGKQPTPYTHQRGQQQSYRHRRPPPTPTTCAGQIGHNWQKQEHETKDGGGMKSGGSEETR